MKNILITGANSYVGNKVKEWLMKDPNKYYIESISLRDSSWKDFDFSKFDVIYHVAGIAHVSRKRSMKNIYLSVNRDLTIEVAKKAKLSGVKHFIFMSSMIVYGSNQTRITRKTIPCPDNFYGLSKLEAEEGLLALEDKNFKVCIIRSPMIYGPNSKGNFIKLIGFAKKTFLFPKYNNKRSMIYIDNLSNVIKYLIDNSKRGIYFPQNSNYVSTLDIIKYVSKFYKRKIWYTNSFNIFIRLFKKKIDPVNKVFSDFYYDIDLSKELFFLNIINFETSLKNSLINGVVNE